MAVITPQTDVYLLKCPLEISDLNQLTFSNATAQYNYFNSLPKLTVNNFTYQRKDNTIRYGANFDSLLSYNYVMYRNDAFSNKWFYAFITGMEYLNDNVTAISIKTDTFQTWQFDLTYKPVLIDREHVNDDTIGANILPEGLELGEMVCNGNVVNFGGGQMDNVNKRYYVIIEVSQIDNRGDGGTISYQWVSGSHDLTPAINGIERGTIPLVIGGTFAGSTSGAIREPSDITYLFDAAGLGESIINMYILPQELVPPFNEVVITATPNTGSVVTMDGIGVPVDTNTVLNLGTTTFSRPTSIRGFVPKNNKLFTYPYNYFNLSNNAGTSTVFHYEDFSGNVEFKTEGTFGISGSTKTIPQNYKFISSNENALDYSVTGPKFPVCSWKSDSYTNWLTQNSVNMETKWRQSLVGGLVQGGLTIGGAVASGNIGLGLVAGAAAVGSGIIQEAREQHLAKTQANFTPDQVSGNTGAGDFLWAKYRSPFTFIPMSIKPQIARCIDEYFSQFGYKCNRVKVPNITGRRNWNYVKTVGCYIEGDVPQEDLTEIKNMFDKGITLWHNPATFADYSQVNDII